MSFNKVTIATIAVISTLALQEPSRANSIYHAAAGEPGFTFHPDHAKNAKSRAEVIAELDAARKDGSLALIQRAAPLPIKNAGSAKTRQQVIDEMRNESPEERRMRMELAIGG